MHHTSNNIPQNPQNSFCSDDFSFATIAKLLSPTASLLFDRFYWNLRLMNPIEVFKKNTYSVTVNQQLFAKDYGISLSTANRLFADLKQRKWIIASIPVPRQALTITPQWKQIIKDVYETGGRMKPIWNNAAFEYQGKSYKCMTWEMMLDVTDIVPSERKEETKKPVNWHTTTASLLKVFPEAAESLKKVWRKYQGKMQNDAMQERDFNEVGWKVYSEYLCDRFSRQDIPQSAVYQLFMTYGLEECMKDWLEWRGSGKQWKDLEQSTQRKYIIESSYDQALSFAKKV